MAEKKKIPEWKLWVFFWGFLVILIIFNFVKPSGLPYFWWHLSLHAGVVVFSLGVLLFSLKLNEKAMKYIIIGTVLGIIIESVYFMSHIFKEYYFLESYPIINIFGIIAFLIIMKGFGEAVR